MRKTFIQLSRAWYGEATLEFRRKKPIPVVDTITIIIEGNGLGGGLSECKIEWEKLCESTPYPRLKMFSDAWQFFEVVPELFQRLAAYQDKDPPPETICKMLEDIGFTDITSEKEVK